MDLRHFTVGYRPVLPRMPFVRLAGRWLERAGFGIGTAVRVQVRPGLLVIEAIEPDRPVRPRARRMAGD